jgi:RND family efflux transporter MFP subunit
MHVNKRDLSELRIDPRAREKRDTGRRPLIWLILILAILAIVITWQLTARRAPAVEIATAREVPVGSAAVLNASGYVTPRRRATVSAKITGKVVEVLIEEGIMVGTGQVLARLDTSDAVKALRAVEAERNVARARLSELEVALANARRTLGRSAELHSRELVSEQVLDDAETAVKSLQAQIILASEQIAAAERSVAIAVQGVDNCTIRAPFAGVVVSKDAQPGEMVSPVSAGGGFTRTGIATIVDMESLEIEVDVNESYIARVVPGQGVEAVLDAYPDWRIPAHVRTVIPTADRQKATVKVRIVFEELDHRILPDMGVKVSFLEKSDESETTSRVLVPNDAIHRHNGETIVYVVKDNVLERRAVRLGGERGGEVEVIAGLRDGETVAIDSGEALRDGRRVTVRR